MGTPRTPHGTGGMGPMGSPWGNKGIGDALHGDFRGIEEYGPHGIGWKSVRDGLSPREHRQLGELASWSF